MFCQIKIVIFINIHEIPFCLYRLSVKLIEYFDAVLCAFCFFDSFAFNRSLQKQTIYFPRCIDYLLQRITPRSIPCAILIRSYTRASVSQRSIARRQNVILEYARWKAGSYRYNAASEIEVAVRFCKQGV